MGAGALFLGLFAWPAQGLAAADEAAQRQQLAAERRAADSRFQQAQADCRQRFALNACIDDARAAHRRALAGVKERERVLDEGQRRQRALDRQTAIDRRQQVAEERPPEPDARPLARGASAARPSARREGDARRARDAAVAQAKAAERAAAARKLQAAIEADQARIKERLAKREAQGRKAQPLPSPASASATASASAGR